MKFATLFLISVVNVFASVVHVPADYATLQEGLDNLQENDTLLADPGTYAESLLAPNISFTLMGNLAGDTTRPVMDPSSLPESNTLACLELTGSPSVTVRDFVFRNDSTMRNNREYPTWCGGIISNAELLTVIHCDFDSVASPIHNGAAVTIDSSRLFGSRYAAVFLLPTGVLNANHSTFDGDGSFTMVWGMSGSQIRNCRFSGGTLGHLLQLTGDDILVDSCDFGPFGPHGGRVFHIYPGDNCRITHNTFHDCGTGSFVMDASPRCDAHLEPPLLIADNTFINNYPFSAGQGYAIDVNCQQDGASRIVEISNNVFDSSSVNQSICVAIRTHSNDLIESNRFINLISPPSIPVLYLGANRSENVQTEAHVNSFLPESFAAFNATSNIVDATLNWWGDGSGPFHPQFNPQGQGATVGDNITFDPWLTDTIASAPFENETPLPENFSITAFPNPFNNTTTIAFELRAASDVKLIVYDLLGRNVLNETLTLPPGFHHEPLDFSPFASGLYFVELRASGQSARAKIMLLK